MEGGLNQQVDIYLYGVLTEACILQTVLDLFKIKNEFYQLRNIYLVDELVHSIDEQEKQIAKFRLISIGAQFI